MNYDKKVTEAYTQFLEKGGDKVVQEVKEELSGLAASDTLFELPDAKN